MGILPSDGAAAASVVAGGRLARIQKEIERVLAVFYRTDTVVRLALFYFE